MKIDTERYLELLAIERDDIWNELKELKFEIKELRNIIEDKGRD